MLFYFGFGVLVLAVGILLLRAFVEANPAKLARGARTAVIVAACAFALLVLIYFIASERIGLGLVEIGVLVPLALRGFAHWQRLRVASGPLPNQTSEVETDYLHMRLDHETGTMSGTVRRGPLRGRHLVELSRDELIELWRDCRADDAQAAKLLEAYFDRLMPGWRETRPTGDGVATGGGDEMTREEAYAILGLAAGVDEAAIREAYQRLMKKIQPGGSGSAYLVAKINRAREILLS
jgi:hypothetical protein